MLRATKRRMTVIITGVVTIFVFAIYIDIFRLSVEDNENFIALAPSGIRSFYLDKVFSIRNEDCRPCRFRLVSALHAVQNDAEFYKNSYQYDYTKILPFIKNSEDDTGGFSEPIYQMACNIILLSNDRKLFVKMAEMYRATPSIPYSCVVQADWIKRERPAQYQDIRQNLQSIAAYAPMLKRVDDTSGLHR